MNEKDKTVLVAAVIHWVDNSDEEDVKELLKMIVGPIVCTAVDDFIEAGVLEKKW